MITAQDKDCPENCLDKHRPAGDTKFTTCWGVCRCCDNYRLDLNECHLDIDGEIRITKTRSNGCCELHSRWSHRENSNE